MRAYVYMYLYAFIDHVILINRFYMPNQENRVPSGYHYNGLIATHALGYTQINIMSQLPVILRNCLICWTLFSVHWYQQCVTVDRLPKCTSCCKVMMIITTEKTHLLACFQIFGIIILLIWDLSTYKHLDRYYRRM